MYIKATEHRPEMDSISTGRTEHRTRRGQKGLRVVRSYKYSMIHPVMCILEYKNHPISLSLLLHLTTR